MSRNFCVRTGVTGVSCCDAPLYRMARAFVVVTFGGSVGYLSSITAPPPAERCGSAPKANRPSITAVRHRRDAIRARKMTKAERRTFFVFIVRISGDESQTGTRGSCETPNVFFSFSGNHPVVSLCERRVQTFCERRVNTFALE